jgi:hypothetical protein
MAANGSRARGLSRQDVQARDRRAVASDRSSASNVDEVLDRTVIDAVPSMISLHSGPSTPIRTALLEVGSGWGNRAVASVLQSRSPIDRAIPVQRALGPSLVDPAVMIQAFVAAADKAEFDLIRRKITDREGKEFKDAAAYAEYRNKVFGSRDAYLAYAAEADAELDRESDPKKVKKWNRLREQVELKGSPAAQTVYYRWVRKAYQTEAGIDDVPRLIRRRMTPEVAAAIARVQTAYGSTFRHGGFNPRPMKTDIEAGGKYRLGTLSEHGLGTAVDIESGTNPALSLKQWKWIQQVAGKKVDRSASRWSSEPQKLWADIHALDEAFVAEIGKRIATEEQRRAKEAGEIAAERVGIALPRTGPPKARDVIAHTYWPLLGSPPIDAVMGKQKALKPYARTGFFALEWELVHALHAEGFTWGATFPNMVDLHHFELKVEPEAEAGGEASP